jgi:MFS family permease
MSSHSLVAPPAQPRRPLTAGDRPARLLAPASGAVVVAVVFVVAMAFATVPTPLYSLYQQRLELSSVGITLVFAAYAAGVMGSLYLAGHVSDWVGRRRMLTTGLLLELAAAVLFVAWPALPGLLLARLITGVGIGLFTATASAALIDLRLRAAPSSSPAAATIVAGLASLGGFAVGPLLSGAAAEVLPEPLVTPYLLAAAALAACCLALRFVPETVARAVTPRIALPRFSRLPRAAQRPYRAALLMAAIAFSVLGLFSSLAPGMVASMLHEPSLLLAGSVAFVVFGASALAQIVMARAPFGTALPGGIAALVVGLGITVVSVWASDAAAFLAGAAVAGIGGGLVMKAALATVARIAPPGQRSEALTGLYLAGYAGLALPVVGVGIALGFADAGAVLTGFALALVLPLLVVTPRLIGRSEPLRSSATSTPSIHRAGSRGFRRATSVHHLGSRPAAELATVVRSPAQARLAVEHAAALGVGVGMHSTGHGTSHQPRGRKTLQVRVEIDEAVTVDPDARTARIPAGTRWSEVVAATAPFGLAVPHGSSGDVGAVGYLLRGGLSVYGRAFGLASNSILSIEIVLADGSEIVAGPAEHPDLFWALRGGGGGFGVVTAITVALRPVAAVVTGAAFWSLDAAPEILEQWRRWTAGAPTAATTSLRILSVTPFFGVPGALTRQKTICVDGAVLAPGLPDAAEAERIAAELLDPLRSIAAPLFDSWRLGPLTETPATHMDPSLPAPVRGDHLLLDDVDADAALELLALAGPGSPLVVAELRQLGGELAAPSSPGGAVDRLRGRFSFQAMGLVLGRRGAERLDRRFRELRTVLEPFASGYTLPTFAERPASAQRSFDAATARRVAGIRRAVDPTGVFADDVSAGARVGSPDGDA